VAAVPSRPNWTPRYTNSIEAPRQEDLWGSGGLAPTFLTSALDGGKWSVSHLVRFTPEVRAASTHWIGEKKLALVLARAGNRTLVVQLVACRYTDSANPTRLTL
jgi:hypothetical protein